MDPKSPLRRSFSPVPAGGCFRSHFGLFLDPPEPRKSCSRLGREHDFQKSSLSLGEPKIDLKWAQHRIANEPQRPPDGPKNRSESMLHFEVNSKSEFNDFGTPTSIQKSIKNQPGRQKAAQTPPGHPQESPRRLPRSHFGNF